MKNRWDDKLAAGFSTDLELRVFSSRLLGQDPALVLHGGGNTSVKIREQDIFGEAVDILYVKGSGWDLATIEPAGFTPIRLDHLLRLSQLESLTDMAMVNEMKTHQTIASAPAGSVEAILHAVLPYKYVDHTHADAIVTITNTPGGEQRIRELFGHEVVVIPYIMPGFDLAREVARLFAEQATDDTKGMVLMNHGMFSFGDTARISYDRMIEFVDRAENYLQQQNAWVIAQKALTEEEVSIDQLAGLRRKLSDAAGFPMIVATDSSADSLGFCQRGDLASISRRGPATPDHVIRTKQLPMIGDDIDAYVAAYQRYFDEQAPHARTPVTRLDPAPRVILDSRQGLITAGKTVKEALINRDIYQHTMEIIQRAEMLEQWQALPSRDIFDVEYWELEQAKLAKGGTAPEFQGEIVWVTGAASGIGKACAEVLLSKGAAVVGLDRDDSIVDTFDSAAWLGIPCDITRKEQRQQALQSTVRHFGGLDMLILNAGLFPGGTRIADLDDEAWRQVMSVNLDANLSLMRECYPLLKQAPRYGRVVVIGSKNFLAPGPGAAAYSASKAALNQLARVAALEWAKDGIRINSLHPDAVFDTALWNDDILAARAAHYGMSVDAYKTKNLLKTTITSRDVAELAAAMCGELFAKTTAAQVPVDGGNDRVI